MDELKRISSHGEEDDANQTDEEELILPPSSSLIQREEEELKRIAESIDPNMTSLLQTKNQELDKLLSTATQAWREEEEQFRLKHSSAQMYNDISDDTNTNNNSDDDSDNDGEDGMSDEWNNLGGAEESLRDELEMSDFGLKFMKDYHHASGGDFEEYTSEEEEEEEEEEGDIVLEDDDYEKDDESEQEHNNMDATSSQQQQQQGPYKNLMDEMYESSSEDIEQEDVISTNTDENVEREENSNNITKGRISTNNTSEIDMEREKANTTITSSTTSTTSAIMDMNNTRNDQPTIASIPNNNNNNNNKNTTKNNNNNNLLPKNKKQKEACTYTLYDHAKTLGLEFNNVDLGYPTVPLLSYQDVKEAVEAPSFHPSDVLEDNVDDEGGFLGLEEDEMGDYDAADDGNGGGGGGGGGKMDKQKEELVREVIQCAREYLKPMKPSLLAKIYSGFVGETKKKRNSKKKRRKKKDGNDGDNPNTSEEDEESSSSSKKDEVTEDKDVLPIRTVAIRIRPDILCGAVMDAVYTAVQNAGGEVTKRQGGHLRAILPGRWIPEEDYDFFRPHDTTIRGGMSSLFSPTRTPRRRGEISMALLPPFLIDVQICTRRRSRHGERVLLVRSFRIEEAQLVDGVPCPSHMSSETNDGDDFDGGKIIREASALFQRIRVASIAGGSVAFDLNQEQESSSNFVTPVKKKPSSYISPPPSTSQKSSGGQSQKSTFSSVLASPLRLFSGSKPSPRPRAPRVRNEEPRIAIGQKSAKLVASKKLMGSFQETPSVQYHEQPDVELLPSLSIDDWPYVQSTWRFLRECLSELDSLDLDYSTLASSPFGAFPALPTLDVHYCSQIRSLCRDNMIDSLLKAAQELEQFAREAEYSCALVTQALQATFHTYELEAPPLPEYMPLSAYPLDFKPPEETCPPWGQKVIEALNRVAANNPSSSSINHDFSPPTSPFKTTKSGEEKSEFERCREAVVTVLTAFQRQEDEELSARLSRKNVQVMDRLAKMQAFKREAIITIRDAYGSNTNATKEADTFHSYARDFYDSSNTPIESVSTFNAASDQVPLLTCRILIGHSVGTCYVTAHQICVVTQLFSLLGGNNVHLMSVLDINVRVNQPSKSLLNPLPSSISICESYGDQKELFKFRPSLGAEIFKEFIETTKAVAMENPDALKFSSRGGLLYMFDEKETVAKAALGSDKVGGE